ncbi:MAG: hypothetical protein ACI9O4_001821 [Chitinophagales bacterium]|jgi:hypothetical protein|tara:strand:+ start:119 stop:472 length:354 start_codon:yes stop_codon:yes gene_type:complete
MSTEEVAKQYHQWAEQGNWAKIQEELYSQDAWSIEAEVSQMTSVQGIEAIKQKGIQWANNIKETHGGYCKEPQVAGNHFSCAMGADYTDIKGERQKLDEVCVFEVQNGKIVKEQFFY